MAAAEGMETSEWIWNMHYGGGVANRTHWPWDVGQGAGSHERFPLGWPECRVDGGAVY